MLVVDLVPALLAMLAGHIFRAMRQSTLFPSRERPRTFYLTIGLAIGYVVNTLIPFRLGELVRALYVSIRSAQGLGRVGATIVAERFSDLICVTIIFLLVPWFVETDAAATHRAAAYFLGAAIVIMVGTLIIKFSRSARKLIWLVAGIFNDAIHHTLVDFVWSTTRILTTSIMLRPRYIGLSILMWSLYITSYALLSRAVGLEVDQVITGLLGAPFQSILFSTEALGNSILLVTGVAALLIIAAGLVADLSGFDRALRRALHYGLSPSDDTMLSAAFVSADDYGSVLRDHFAGTTSAISNFALTGLDGALVHRILPGGSDAVTAVVEVSDSIFIRKFATGNGAKKLAEQAEWLKAHQGELPLAAVLSEQMQAVKFRYDMPYPATARDFYEVIHTVPIARSLAILHDVFNQVGAHHERNNGQLVTDKDILSYATQKVVANAKEARDFGRLMLAEQHVINGETFSFSEWAPLFDPDWILKQMPTRATTAIHGDLTIENIVICHESEPGWYLIDANTGNFFGTAFIDWAKLLQSLHFGYETLNRSVSPKISGDVINVPLARSRAYAELYEAYCGMLAQRYDVRQIREIYFHEIVNYLRLIPYKIRHSPARAMTFIALVSILLRNYQREDHV